MVSTLLLQFYVYLVCIEINVKTKTTCITVCGVFSDIVYNSAAAVLSTKLSP